MAEKGGMKYMLSSVPEFPLEKINTLIPEVKENFQGEIYFFFAYYDSWCADLSDSAVINLFGPEDRRCS